MTATNHALTGATIGILIGKPLLAVPVALLSHFICDAVPHFGFTGEKLKKRIMRGNSFRNYLVVEAIICFVIVLAIAVLRPAHWQLAAWCAFVAASPDLLSYKRYRATRSGTAWSGNLYSRFAHDIQWFERPIGALVEVAWLVAALVILAPFFR